MRACLFLALRLTTLASAADAAAIPAAVAVASTMALSQVAPSKPDRNARPSAPKVPSKPPSIADTKSVTFIGKQFDLKFHAAQQVIPLYEYYPAKDTPELWMELVDFRIYPVNPNGNAPIDHAGRTAAEFKQKYPSMNFALYQDNKGTEALLDFFYPTSTRKEAGKSFLEFNAFKFFS